MRQSIFVAVALFALALLPSSARADEARCGELFPGVDWVSVDADGPATVATAGMNTATSERYAADVARVAAPVHAIVSWPVRHVQPCTDPLAGNVR